MGAQIAVAIAVVVPILCFVSWLAFATAVVRRHPPDEAARIIEATGRWYPFRRRRRWRR